MGAKVLMLVSFPNAAKGVDQTVYVLKVVGFNLELNLVCSFESNRGTGHAYTESVRNWKKGDIWTTFGAHAASQIGS